MTATASRFRKRDSELDVATSIASADRIPFLQSVTAGWRRKIIAFSDFVASLGSLGSPNVIYLSQLDGIHADGSFTSPTTGTDDTTVIQAAIDAAPAGTTFVVDGVFKAHPNLKSGHTYDGLIKPSYSSISGTYVGNGFVCSAGADACLRNKNWRSPWNGSSLLTDYTRVVDENITIRNLLIHGNRGTGAVGNASNGGSTPHTTGIVTADDTTGDFPICAISFFGVRNLTLENVYVYDSPYFAGWFAYIDGGTFSDNTWRYGAAGILQDGFHFTGPCRNLVERNCRGSTCTDEFLPHNAMDGVAYGSAHFSIVANGTISNVNIEGVYPDDLHCGGVVFRTGSDAHGTYAVNDVTVRDVVLSNAGSAAFFLTSFGGTTGSFGRVTLQTPRVTSLTVVSSGNSFLGVYPSSGSFTIDELNIESAQLGTLVNYADLGFVCGFDSVTINTLNFTGFQIKDAGSAIPFLAIFSGTYGVIKFHNFTWNNTGTAAGQLVSVQGGTITSLELNGVSLDRVANAVNYSAGTISNITSTGLRHTNSNGNASFALGAAVARFRAAGSNTALLKSGTAPTSSKTDSTEDA